MFRSEMLIGGEWVEGTGEILPVQNPATEETLGTIRNATPAETDRAIHAARRAFPEWAAMSPFKRAVLLHKAGDLIAERQDAIARLMTAEQGKPLNEAAGEVAKLAQTLHFYAEEGVRVHGEIIPNESNSYQSLVVREPIGVVAAISPWNYPAELIGWKIGGALAAGCTIVVKPAASAPPIFQPINSAG